MNFSIKELNELIYSLGITALNGKMLDKELNQSLMEKLHAELAYKMSLEVEDGHIEIEHSNSHWNELSEKEEWLENRLSEDSFPHYVTNEEADEDAFKTWNEAPYGNDDEDTDYKPKGVTQAILDYVENTGPSTYTELNDFYKFVTGGSNSFSHILKALRIPYKNRPTRRYLHKATDGKYVVKIAGLHNWVVKQGC